MDLPRLFAMDRRWLKNPPLRDMVQAAFFGPIETSDRTSTNTASSSAETNDEKALDDFIKMFTDAGGTVK